ncbi:MAG TPA: tyrosine-type recombinase/integrase [Chitinophagales bacterium]|nr:tyrosine-type recombinase/integrase [Chitinophagales bacterium]
MKPTILITKADNLLYIQNVELLPDLEKILISIAAPKWDINMKTWTIENHPKHIEKLSQLFNTQIIEAKNTPLILSEHDISHLLKSIDNVKHKTLMIMLYSSGLSINEILEIKKENFQIHHNKVFILNTNDNTYKKILLPESYLNYLQKYLAKYQPKKWFFERRIGTKYTIINIEYIYRKSMQNAKLNSIATLYSLRFSFYNHLLKNGADIHYVKNVINNQSIPISSFYSTNMSTEKREFIYSA